MLKDCWKQIKSIGDDFKNESVQVVFLITIIMLLVEYFGWQRPFFQVIAPQLGITALKQQMTLYAQMHTTLSFLLCFVFIPILYYKTFGKGLMVEGIALPKRKDAGPYMIFAVIMLVVLAFACSSPGFYQFYPLYRPQNLGQWVMFEAIYLPQFIAVEFFFRGPLLFTLNEKIGRLAIIFMTLPYALVHIHKPFPEAIGSIGAGLVLGHYSLKSKSIWFGVLLHMLIAISADFFGLFYSGTFSRW